MSTRTEGGVDQSGEPVRSPSTIAKEEPITLPHSASAGRASSSKRSVPAAGALQHQVDQPTGLGRREQQHDVGVDLAVQADVDADGRALGRADQGERLGERQHLDPAVDGRDLVADHLRETAAARARP